LSLGESAKVTLDVQRVVPVLGVADFSRARRFYTESLGFATDWVWQPDDASPVFAQLSRGGLSIYLSRDPATSCPGASSVYLYVDDVDAWRTELGRRGVALEQEPITRAWGNRELVVRDPDGNRLTLATPRTTSPDAG
jgi:catechol 2,3-dioxygenase-like lactoylglutathione lyase family enzyme